MLARRLAESFMLGYGKGSGLVVVPGSSNWVSAIKIGFDDGFYTFYSLQPSSLGVLTIGTPTEMQRVLIGGRWLCCGAPECKPTRWFATYTEK